MTQDPSLLTPDDLAAMAAAGETVAGIEAGMRALGTNPRELLLEGVKPEDFRHYPAGDVYDFASHSQYYMHGHRDGEYGHLHLFLRPKGMPPQCKPAVAVGGADSPCHLIAVGLGHNGFACELFTTNRWVTGESWYAADDVTAMLPRLGFEGSNPGARVGRWAAALLALYRPLVITLVQRRDQTVAEWAAAHGGKALDDDRLEITSRAAIDVHLWRQALDAEIERRAI
ncbi:MAG TPA: hypothetical protein VL974_00125 [Magnetospirillum sp.]|jgi:hypothetical protein|nr:hypothetical protein [Magnetospirillum sp.]